ncbi:MAG TPA: acetyl-CoA hydrolase/transferase C-terminal domain-containing protein [Saprospiraceae bacterium]|nr:acetyl-CoA hydrolase/transferase C-terminal domain-containing protein [Saprospiraceae bacterium]HMP14569.1 acetyl-CoA hydrolase/transferase C-terminal domain-containing protein [Saprospiraceae bacterium]
MMPTHYTPVSAEEAVAVIRTGDKIFIHSAAAAPQVLVQALVARADELREVEIYQLHTEGYAPYAEPQFEHSFHVKSLFTGANVRQAIQDGRADFVPIFLSDIPRLFRRGVVQLDAALLQVSPPDAHGYCTLGVSVDTSLAAAQTAKLLIAEINPNMPRTNGDGNIHISKFHKVVEVDYPMHQLILPPPDEVETRIGNYIANLVEDGATIQMGIGAIPNAALAAMEGHRELGVHTEMFSDGILSLFEKGVITNQHKVRHRNHIVTGFLVGSQRLYDFVNANPIVRVLDIQYVNDTAIIRQNPKATAINSAIEVDLSGQVCADSIGTRIYSGVGGQLDFVRGSALSEGGKPIIALPSVTNKGISRITCMLKPGAGVVTTRAHVHYIVTEYGVANLFGKSIRERAKALIDIAHPDHRERLAKEAAEVWHVHV